jgi:hypothetical protein
VSEFRHPGEANRTIKEKFVDAFTIKHGPYTSGVYEDEESKRDLHPVDTEERLMRHQHAVMKQQLAEEARLFRDNQLADSYIRNPYRKDSPFDFPPSNPPF